MEVTPHTVFTPAKEVQDIERFAGREDELRNLSNALQADGAQIVLYGNRGIGKSSLARVLSQLAVNDAEVVNRLPERPFVNFDYLPIYFSCDDSITSIERLFIRLLTDEGALAPWVPFKVVERKVGGEVGGKASLKVIELSGKATDSLSERVVEVESDVVSTFTNACAAIAKSKVAKSGLLLIIDEFDRIKDRTGLASILKALGPEGVTFAFVGVATDIQELISEHESVARQLSEGAVYVKPMSERELHEIISLGMTALGDKYSFELGAAEWIVSIARGHPYYVHLVAKHALLTAISAGQTVVTVQMAREALADIALKGAAPVQEATYKTAIGHSYIREFVLKKFAASFNDEIHTTDLYASIAKELGIDSGAISVYVGHLANEKYGAVLAKTRERYYRFSDSLFKAYAAARPRERQNGDTDPDA